MTQGQEDNFASQRHAGMLMCPATYAKMAQTYEICSLLQRHRQRRCQVPLPQAPLPPTASALHKSKRDEAQGEESLVQYRLMILGSQFVLYEFINR
jgi:hypothetical protein